MKNFLFSYGLIWFWYIFYVRFWPYFTVGSNLGFLVWSICFWNWFGVFSFYWEFCFNLLLKNWLFWLSVWPLAWILRFIWFFIIFWSLFEFWSIFANFSIFLYNFSLSWGAAVYSTLFKFLLRILNFVLLLSLFLVLYTPLFCCSSALKESGIFIFISALSLVFLIFDRLWALFALLNPPRSKFFICWFLVEWPPGLPESGAVGFGQNGGKYYDSVFMVNFGGNFGYWIFLFTFPNLFPFGFTLFWAWISSSI